MHAAVYIRKSREDKSKAGYRLSLQRQLLPSHAQTQGWQVTVYDDGHASAARGKVEALKVDIIYDGDPVMNAKEAERIIVGRTGSTSRWGGRGEVQHLAVGHAASALRLMRPRGSCIA